MIDANSTSNASKKKFLVPVIVLLLCMVSLAGAAYAYTSSVTTHGEATANAFYVELYDDGGDPTTVPVNLTDTDVVTFTTDMDYEQNKVVVTATHVNKAVATAYVKVNTTVDGQTTAKIKFESALVTLAAPALPAGLTLQASLPQGSVTQDGAELTADSNGYYTVETNKTIEMSIFVTVDGTSTWNSTTTTYPHAEDAIEAFHDSFEENAKFVFKLTAENIVTP